ncbi:unnamed protein product [Eruca vesicaria subsp. sativa]|uniref:Transcription factor CBF/NF-Y/archaeal histone domain-containing protein n=1 Tax=Eruca vesicaria subsp. sativa TaxID=29727 RepID=A0ABC8K442_ERUVS|nr:unnamed protein product [Eruca vesicaria subsp. sativa]
MADSQAKSSGMSPGGVGGGSHESGGDQSPRSLNVREQDRFLPIANISRIMKRGLPANGKIAKDAKETMQECVSEFISFITSEIFEAMEAELRRVKVQCEQWRKAAETAASILNNEEERMDSVENGKMLKKFGVLLKKNHK